MTSTDKRDVTKNPPQRKRGRPPTENPLSVAERAKRYRARKKDRALPFPDGEVRPSSEDEKNAMAEQYIADLRGGIETIVEYASKGKRVPLHILVGLLTLLDRKGAS